MPDEIIKELWEIKDTIAEEYDCDVRALVAHLRKIKHPEDHQPMDLRGRKLTTGQDTQAGRQHNGGL